MASATDVPARFDIIINGQGYILSNTVDESLPFRVQRGDYSYTRTFVDRTNTGAAYGDDQQAFWQTLSQNDWSLGEQQKFFRNDETRKRRYYQGTNVDVRTMEGQVSIRPATASTSFAAAVRAIVSKAAHDFNLETCSSTNLYLVRSDGSITDRGAHGLGAAPSRYGAVMDDSGDIYLASRAGGAIGVRKYDGAFSTFSASTVDGLEFLNNTLYGWREDIGDIVSFSTAGALTSVFTWKGADGGARTGNLSRIRAFGGKLLILWGDGAHGPELWQYDGSSTSLVALMPSNFFANDIAVAAGNAYITGAFLRPVSGSTSTFYVRPAMFEYQSTGAIDPVWQAAGYSTSTFATRATANNAGVAAFDDGVIFNDDTRGALMFLDPATGAVSSIGSYTVAGDTPLLGACQTFFLHTRNQTTAYLYPDTTTATTATVTSSLDDFDSSLTKLFRGVKVDFDSATDGNGGSVDISYQTATLDGSFTSLQTGATSGTEYNPSSVTGRSITIKVTLNKGTSTLGPVLKRVYVRAVPVLPQYRLGEFVIDCTGRDGKSHVVLRDGTNHPLDGLAMAQNLITAATATAPFSITDRFGTFTGIVETENFELVELRPEEFLARVRVRQV